MKHDKPRILLEKKSHLILYKPSKMHCVPLQKDESDTLLAWCAEQFPEVLTVYGKKPIEGGIVHRLDYETRGVVLCARTQAAMDSFTRQQETGVFIKNYQANSAGAATQLDGFPKGAPVLSDVNIYTWVHDESERALHSGEPLLVQSAFRAYGAGRKAVRPILNSPARVYTTKITGYISKANSVYHFWISLNRGFRHQIRCHLAWMGYPILNDVLYGGKSNGGDMELFAWFLSFFDPETEDPVSFGY
ncbi:MAG: pseudouridine synthase [Termitinemataceae bacterium]|nr:MAG: pseudouridine synthase [Termitinemataceae bacterium]